VSLSASQSRITDIIRLKKPVNSVSDQRRHDPQGQKNQKYEVWEESVPPRYIDADYLLELTQFEIACPCDFHPLTFKYSQPKTFSKWNVEAAVEPRVDSH